VRVLVTVAEIRENIGEMLAATVAPPIPRRVELQSGAYLDYSYHCTVIVVIRYAPYAIFERGRF
jgi:hypothetical protein